MALFPGGQAAFARHGGALPGRVSTYFNNPYMGQIANNLSSAIYGDPRDELTRQQIENAKATRKSNADAAALEAEGRQSLGTLAAMLPAMYDEKGNIDPAAWSAGVVDSGAAQHMTPEAITSLMPRNAGYLQDDQLAKLASILKINELGAAGDQERQTAEQGHGFDQDILGIEQKFDETQNQLDRAEGMFGGLLDEGLGDEQLYEMIVGKDMPVDFLAMLSENRAADNAPSGGGSGTPPKGTDLKNVEETLYQVLQTSSGDSAGDRPFQQILEDPTMMQAVMAEAAKHYQTSNSAAEAVFKALEAFDVKYTPANERAFWWDDPESMSITPKQGVIRYDAQGNRIQ